MMIEMLRKSSDLNTLNQSIHMTLTYEITDFRPHIVLLISLTTCLYPGMTCLVLLPGSNTPVTYCCAEELPASLGR